MVAVASNQLSNFAVVVVAVVVLVVRVVGKMGMVYVVKDNIDTKPITRKIIFCFTFLPKRGLSEVTGIVAETMFKKTVRLRSMVTPGILMLWK